MKSSIRVAAMIAIVATLGLATAGQSSAGVSSLRVFGYVIEQQCFGEDLFVDMSAIHQSSSEPVHFRWDFDADGQWDTAPNPDPFERPVYFGDGQEIRVRVLARNPERQRATDGFTFVAVDCIPG